MFESDSTPIRLALLAADSDTYASVEKACALYGIIPSLCLAPYDDMLQAARELHGSVDIILCRSGSAEYVQSSIDIPVVSIPITPFGLICAIRGKPVQGKKIAYLSYLAEIPCIDKVGDLFSCTIRQYIYTAPEGAQQDTQQGTQQGILQGILRAREEGADICLGGSVTVRHCAAIGMEAIKVHPNEDTVYRSVAEAMHLVTLRRQERARTVRVSAAFDTLSEGIVVSDNKNNIVICNPAAARMFNVNADEVIGKNAQEMMPDAKMHAVFERSEPKINFLQKIRNDIIAITTLPIMLDGTPIGVVSTVSDVTKIQQLEQMIRKEIHAKGFVAKYTFADIQTIDEAMLECKKLGALYAGCNASVVIQGESGTGKELFAQSIHNASKRAAGPFVAVNCAAIPDTLLESELFGYEGGAFTGAKKEGKPGLFELAHNGTIFLDEISELPPALQARLLRVLQEKEVRRIGGDRIFPVDTRIISATNKNLPQKIAEGLFRDDLFYRLNVFQLQIPPLRARKGDVPLLAGSLLRRMDLQPPDSLIELFSLRMIEYDWPGNVRELNNYVERIGALMAHEQGGIDIPRILDRALGAAAAPRGLLHCIINTEKNLKAMVADVERQIVAHTLAAAGNDQDLAAHKLGIGKTSVWRKIRCPEQAKQKKS